MLKKIFEKVDPKLLSEHVKIEDSKQENLDIVNYDQVSSIELELSGGKDVLVPYYFIVTTRVYKRMIKKFKIIPMIQKLEEMTVDFKKAVDSHSKTRHQRENELWNWSEKIRQKIESVQLDQDFIENISKNYEFFSQKVGVKDLSVAVRSSATTEDLKDASFAGLHSTYLNQKGLKNILLSIKRCWASVFSNRAVQYRALKNVSHLIANVAVVIQKMVFPIVAGTGFTIEIGTSYPGLHVCATLGLGEGLVSGEVTSDEWLLNTKTFNMIKKVCGSKRIQYQILEAGSGIKKVETDQNSEKKFSLDDNMIKKIAKLTKSIGEVYKQLYVLFLNLKSRYGYEFIDTEFALSKTPTIYFLQARPVVPVYWDKIFTVDKKHVNQGDILIKGKYSLLGAVHGIVKIISDFDDLVQGKITIEKDDIIVTHKTGNYWNQYLTELKGIVTMEGSPTAHPMLIGRERKMPCCIGVNDVINKMRKYDGEWVTLDGLNKCVYMGKKPLIEASNKLLEKKFEVVQIEKYMSVEDNINFLMQIKRGIKLKDDSVWIANPNFPVSPFLEKIVMRGYEKRYKCDKPLKNVKNIDGFVREKFKSMKDYTSIFIGMKLFDCEKFHRSYVESSNNFVKMCNDFLSSVKLKKKFEEIIEMFENVLSYKFTSFFFRWYLNVEVSKIANSLDISQFHFERFCSSFQAKLVEEDNLFRKKIIQLAKELLMFAKENSISYNDIKLETLKGKKMFESLDVLSQEFRITKIMNFLSTIPHQKCLDKCLDTIKEFGEDKIMKYVEHEEEDVEEHYFVENEEFRKWAELAIRARVQHCDNHHKTARGQWKLKKKLAQLENFCKKEKILKENERIFDHTPKQVAQWFGDFDESK